MNELKSEDLLDKSINHWQSKYIINILEQDHHKVKSKIPYSNSFQST
ncbi:DDE-type integrase/transposase/recombinase [Peptostreptococcus faecalis]